MTQLDNDDRGALCCLASLPKVGPARLHWLTEAERPAAVLASLASGRLPASADRAPRGVTETVVAQWCRAARSLDPTTVLDTHRRADIAVLAPGDEAWPFEHDPDPPAVLFLSGDPAHLVVGRRVAIVGTRRSTAAGRRVATDFGQGLTAAGVITVSGLALGIDGAAHRGALSDGPGAPVAVVAGGVDHVYPPSHRDLWAQVVDRGLVLSEAPLGTRPDRWRFPARNRLIAGLSELVVVVESHDRGGALLTVDEAADRGIPVAAVPGSVLSQAAAGTNALLVDGCPPVRHVDDLFDLLGITAETATAPGDTTDVILSHEPDALSRAILDELANGELHLERLLARLSAQGFALDLASLIRPLRTLESAGSLELVGNRIRHSERSPLP